jgi:hypothetical protein
MIYYTYEFDEYLEAWLVMDSDGVVQEAFNHMQEAKNWCDYLNGKGG